MHGNMVFSTHYILGTPQQSGGFLVCSVKVISTVVHYFVDTTLHAHKHPLCCGVGKIESLENTMFPCMVCLLQQ